MSLVTNGVRDMFLMFTMVHLGFGAAPVGGAGQPLKQQQGAGN